MSDIPFLTHPDFQFDGIRYGFFTRTGGVSEGVYDSLNCAERAGMENPEHIRENLRRVAAAMQVAPENMLSCRQIHSTHVVTVEAPWSSQQRPEADGMATNRRGIALGIKTADCGPVLFYDATAHVIGACHAGWRGAVGGVMEETLAAMKKLGAKTANISAVLGACIQQNSYEVGPEFPAPFLKQDTGYECFFKKALREEHFLFDMPGYIQTRLRRAGLNTVYSLGFDTCSDEARFFSYRRRTLRGEADNGTLLSVIMLA